MPIGVEAARNGNDCHCINEMETHPNMLTIIVVRTWSLVGTGVLQGDLGFGHR